MKPNCTQGFDIYIYLAVREGKLCCYDNVMFRNILQSKNQYIMASPKAIRFYELKDDSRIINSLSSIHSNHMEKKSVLILETRMWKIREILSSQYEVSICDIIHVPDDHKKIEYGEDFDKEELEKHMVLMSEGLSYFENVDINTFQSEGPYKVALFKYDLYFPRVEL